MANLVSAYGKSFKEVTERLIGTNGTLAAQTEGYNTTIKGFDKQREAINIRMLSIEARYRKQFTALDVMMSKMSQTSNYLTTQLANLSKINSSQ